MSRTVFNVILRSLRSSTLGVVAFAAAVLHPSITEASDPFLSLPDPKVVESTAAYRYANMTNDEAIAELNRRGLPYVTVDPTVGVRAPIRLTGRLHGVLIHSGAAPDQRATSPFEILDARLALALDDFTAILQKHDIDEIEHFSMYRPGVSQRERPKKKITVPAKPSVGPAKPSKKKPGTDKVATRGKIKIPRQAGKPHSTKPSTKPAPSKKDAPTANTKPNTATIKIPPKPQTNLGKAGLDPKKAETSEKGKKQKGADEPEATVRTDKQTEVVAEAQTPQEQTTTTQAAAPPVHYGTRHPGGLAIDVGKMRKKDGTWITVRANFQGKIGAKACGADAPVPASAEAKELRAIVCEAMDNHLFTYVLTPNYNAAHFDHFHMEVKPGVKWFLVH